MKMTKQMMLVLLVASLAWAQGSRRAVNFYDEETGNRNIFVGYCDVNYNFTSAMTITAWVKCETLVQVKD